MSSGRRRKGGHGGEFHLDERWMTSYADMITVLMCLFIVLYAMSTVDSHKFDVLKNSLASGFGVTNSEKLDLTKGVPVPKELVDKNGYDTQCIPRCGTTRPTTLASVRSISLRPWLMLRSPLRRWARVSRACRPGFRRRHRDRRWSRCTRIRLARWFRIWIRTLVEVRSS